MDREKKLLEQYGRLVDIGLHYDQKLWLIPGAGYAVLGILVNAMVSMDTNQLFARAILAIISPMIFSGFLLQLVKDRAFQLGNQYALDQIKKDLEMVDTSEFVGTQPDQIRDRWFIRWTREWSATNTVIYIMMITVLAQIALAIHYLSALFSTKP